MISFGRRIVSEWPRGGPWDGEPDFVAWVASGLPAVALRNDFGAWCGYVAVRVGHPFYGRARAKLPTLPAHGGVTYAEGGLALDAVFGRDLAADLEARFGTPLWVARLRLLARVRDCCEDLASELVARGAS